MALIQALGKSDNNILIALTKIISLLISIVGSDGSLPLAKAKHSTIKFNFLINIWLIFQGAGSSKLIWTYAPWRIMMSRYNFLSLIKQKAKAASRDTPLKLSVAQEQLARSGGFQHFHELIKVAANNPNDIRLMRLALNTDDLSEIIYEDSIYEELNFIIEDLMSADIAGTNALGFFIDDLVVNNSSYNEINGLATIQAEITYTGEQDPDRVFSGAQFYLTVVMTLIFRNGAWSLSDDGCEIIKSTSDQELDWKQQLVGGLI